MVCKSNTNSSRDDRQQARVMNTGTGRKVTHGVPRLMQHGLFSIYGRLAHHCHPLDGRMSRYDDDNKQTCLPSRGPLAEAVAQDPCQSECRL